MASTKIKLFLSFRLLPFGLLLSFGLLTSCASYKTNYTKLSPEQRVQFLAKNCRWQTAGRMGVHDGKTGTSARLNWQQQGEYFKIYLYGPLHIESVTVRGVPGSKIELDSSDGTKLTATTPEELIYQRLGWSIPVTSMMYWLRGLPAPYSPVTNTEYTPKNLLTRLEQNGWQINFLNYKEFRHKTYLVSLPEKILLYNKSNDIKLKLLLNKWQFVY